MHNNEFMGASRVKTAKTEVSCITKWTEEIKIYEMVIYTDTYYADLTSEVLCRLVDDLLQLPGIVT